MKLDQKTLGYITVFEGYTTARVKDCFFDNDKKLVFVVKEGDIGKAIGKKGINIKTLKEKFRKNIRVIEFSDDMVKFVKNLIYPIKTNVEKKDEKVVISEEDKKIKGQLFGRDRIKLKEMQEIVKRYFDVEVVIE